MCANNFQPLRQIIEQPLGLYLHFPFCARRCPYCDFTLTTAPIPHTRYLSAVSRELKWRIEDLKRRGWRPQPLRSLYIGGGTPGLWDPVQLAKFIECAQRALGFAEGIEITIEANPGEVTAELTTAWVDAGVNRLSLGAQSLRAEALTRLGRDHTPDDVSCAVQWARSAGIKRISIDLMHGLKGEGEAEALIDLERALDLDPDHISLYQLTIEERTAFGVRARRGESLLEPDERLAEIYIALERRLQTSGFQLYEVSNAARPGGESRHNSLYWTMGQYLGVGVGAHGRVDLPSTMAGSQSLRWSNRRRVSPYLDGVDKLEGILDETRLDETRLDETRLDETRLDEMTEQARELLGEARWALIEEEREVLEAEALAEERVLVGLRLACGVVITPDLERRFGAHAQALIAAQLLERSPREEGAPLGRWRATQRGRALLDSVTHTLILG